MPPAFPNLVSHYSFLSSATRRPGDVQPRRHGGAASGGRGDCHGDGNQPPAGAQEAVRHHQPRHRGGASPGSYDLKRHCSRKLLLLFFFCRGISVDNQTLVFPAAGRPHANPRRTTAQQNAKPRLREPHLQILRTDELSNSGCRQVMPDPPPLRPPNSYTFLQFWIDCASQS